MAHVCGRHPSVPGSPSLTAASQLRVEDDVDVVVPNCEAAVDLLAQINKRREPSSVLCEDRVSKDGCSKELEPGLCEGAIQQRICAQNAPVLVERGDPHHDVPQRQAGEAGRGHPRPSVGQRGIVAYTQQWWQGPGVPSRGELGSSFGQHVNYHIQQQVLKSTINTVAKDDAQ